jgi:hypothetical protein
VTGFAGKNGSQCERLHASLEEITARDSVPTGLAEHAASCADCRTALDELFASRALLSAVPRHAAAANPWFATRVMAAIAEQEDKLQSSLEPWTVVPRLASRLAWVSAIALLLTSSWLIERPNTAPSRTAGTDLAGEPLIESHPAPANNDEVLFSLTERME